MKQSSKKLLALLTAGLLCTGSLGFLPASAETEGETDENNTIETAEAIEVNTAVTGNISNYDDKDYYKIELSEDGNISFHFSFEKAQSYTSSYWNLSLLDNYGRYLHTYEIGGQKMTFDSDVQGLKANTYYVLVENGSNTSSDPYTFSANYVTASASDTVYEAEHNDTTEEANSLTFDTDTKGNLHNRDDVDYYKVVLDEDGTLSSSFTRSAQQYTSSNYWKLSLIDADENNIQSWKITGAGGIYRTDVQGLKAGTYYYVVSDDNEFSDSTYTLNTTYVPVSSAKDLYEAEFNNDLETANTIAINTKYSGSIRNNTDVDYYAVTLEEAGSLAIQFENPEQSYSGFYWNVSLLYEDGTEVASWNQGGKSTKSLFKSTGLRAGAYYIAIKNSNEFSSDTYTFQAIFTSSTKDQQYESENNDEIENANSFALNSTITGNLHKKTDVDYYELTLPEDGMISFTFKHKEQSYSSNYWKYSLTDADGTKICTWNIGGKTNSQQTSKMGLKKGTYLVKIESSSSDYSSDDYNITNVFDTTGSFEAESNDTISAANAIPVATACTGNLYKDNDVDYYSFTLENSNNVSLTFKQKGQNYSTSYWIMQILSEDGEKLSEENVSGTALTTSSESIKLDAGTYYVKISSAVDYSDANYTLTINADEITYLKGDVNGDGAVNAMDVSALLVSSARQAVGYTEGVLTGENALAADVNEDGEINAMDASYILTYSAKMGAGLDVDWDSLIGK